MDKEKVIEQVTAIIALAYELCENLRKEIKEEQEKYQRRERIIIESNPDKDNWAKEQFMNAEGKFVPHPTIKDLSDLGIKTNEEAIRHIKSNTWEKGKLNTHDLNLPDLPLSGCMCDTCQRMRNDTNFPLPFSNFKVNPELDKVGVKRGTINVKGHDPDPEVNLPRQPYNPKDEII
jgi:hypothetical protein